MMWVLCGKPQQGEMVKVSGDIKLTGLPLRDRLRICKITLERKFIFVWGGETNSLGTVEELFSSWENISCLFGTEIDFRDLLGFMVMFALRPVWRAGKRWLKHTTCT